MAGRKRANGEGTIYQRSDGRWEGAGYVLTTDGASKRVRVYGATRKEAADKLAEKLADSHRGIPATANPTTTLGEYLSRWLTTVVVHRVRPTTYATYDTYVRKFPHFRSGTPPTRRAVRRRGPRVPRQPTNDMPVLCPGLGRRPQPDAPAQGPASPLLRRRRVLPPHDQTGHRALHQGSAVLRARPRRPRGGTAPQRRLRDPTAHPTAQRLPTVHRRRSPQIPLRRRLPPPRPTVRTRATHRDAPR